MSEPNPYETPREPEPLTTGKVVKRGIGVGVILLLTPIAAGIAGFTSCAAYDFLWPKFVPDFEFVFRVIIAVVPLAVVLSGMSWWAIRMHRQTHESSQRWSGFLTIMALTPIVVIAVLGASYVATGYVVDSIKDLGAAITAGVLTFFGPPALALIGMLIAAWRAAKY